MKLKRIKPDNEPHAVIGYVRVSTEQQANEGLSLIAQRQRIEAECARRGWTHVETHADEGVSGKVPPEERNGLGNALDALSSGKGTVLMVCKLDRLSRTVYDVCAVGRLARNEGWSLVIADAGGIDTTSPHGNAQLQMMAVFAELERRLISERTKEGLAVARQNGFTGRRPIRDGLKGGYDTVPVESLDTVTAFRSERAVMLEKFVVYLSHDWELKTSLRKICRWLNDNDIDTLSGIGLWHCSTIKAILERAPQEWHDKAINDTGNGHKHWTDPTIKALMRPRLPVLTRDSRERRTRIVETLQLRDMSRSLSGLELLVFGWYQRYAFFPDMWDRRELQRMVDEYDQRAVELSLFSRDRMVS